MSYVLKVVKTSSMAWRNGRWSRKKKSLMFFKFLGDPGINPN